MPPPSQNFEGVGNVNGVLPPDSNGDVGANHYVQWVNLSFAIYSKGSPTVPPVLLYGPAAGRTLWSGFGGPCETRNDGDPIVLYDHLADRWLFSQLAVPNSLFGLLFGPFYQCIAVSATPDPMGPYYRYQFAFTKLNDYPKFGVWPDGYYMAINQFAAVTLQWAGQGVVAFDRQRMLAGQAATMVYFDLASVDMNLGGMLPADLDGPPPADGSPAYFVQLDDDAWGYSADQLQLWQFHADWANPAASSLVGPAVLPTASFDSNLCGYSRNCLTQPGTTVKVDALSDRLMYRLQYRNFSTHESLVVNHTVDVDGNDGAGIRWYEIRNARTAPVIFQQGTYAPDADHRWMGSAAMDGAGNIALGFSVSGAATSPSIRYTGRLASDPPGVLTQGEADLMIGSGSQTHGSGRWGDYTMLAVDPSDDCTFWYTNEYYATTNSAEWHTRIGAFKFPLCGEEDSSLPQVTVQATDDVASEAASDPAVFTVTRTGDTAEPLPVRYTVAGTAIPNSDYEALSGSVTIAAGAATGAIVVTPVDDVRVEADETVVLTLSPHPTYSVGSPSGAIIKMVSDDIPSDLIVSALTTPATAGADAILTVTDTTKNQGSGASEPSQTGFYLSTDPVLNAGDVFLGSRSVPALNPGASDTASTGLKMPATTATGNYYVVAKADFDDAISESQEGNNVKVSALVRVGPDLTISALTGPATAAPGATILVSDTTKNQGGGGAPASTTRFYLSLNVTLDTSDPILGSRPVLALAAGATDSGTSSLTIPASIAPGTYFILAKADADGAVVETLEFNNTLFSSGLKIGVDLAVTTLTVPFTAGADVQIAVNDTTKNLGSGTSPASTTAFYLSTNISLDAVDVALGSRPVPPLDSGASNSASTSVRMPAGTATGTYYILAKADADNAIAESVETNNVKSASVLIGPDLVIWTFSPPGTAAAGTDITVSDTTKNQGGGAAPASGTGFYLSTNLSVDAGDIFLGDRAVPALAPGATDARSTVLTIPATAAAGTYYLIAKADYNNAVVETQEANNIRARGITISAQP